MKWKRCHFYDCPETSDKRQVCASSAFRMLVHGSHSAHHARGRWPRWDSKKPGAQGATSLPPAAGKGSAGPRETDGLSSNPTPGCDLASPVSEKGDDHSPCQLWHGEGLNAEPALTALGFVPSGHSAVPLWPPPHMPQHILRLHRVFLCRRPSMTFYCDCSYVIVCYSARPKTRACPRGMTR